MTRLRRNAIASVGVVLVGSLAIASAGLSEAIHVRLTGQVDANWRGAYDILVRPSATRLDLERTNGLVEPNFLSYSGHGGIGLDQLARIRAIDGVDLAAPVSFLGYLRYATSTPTIQLTALPSRETLYRATITVTTTDGLGDRILQRETGRVLLGPKPADPSVDPLWVADFSGMTYGVDADGNPILDMPAQHSLPPVAIAVMGVDPIAERALLGPSASFLDVFAKLGPRNDLTVSTMNLDLIPPEFDFARTQIASLRDPHFPTPAAKTRPIVPLVLSDSLYAGLKLRLQVTQLGAPLESDPAGETSQERLDAAEHLAGPVTTVVGETTLDAGAELRPFQPANLVLAWPGSSAAGGAYGIANFGTLETRLTERPSYTAIAGRQGSTRPSFRIESVGIVGPDDAPITFHRDPTAPTTGFQEGAFPAYRSFVSVPLSIDGKGVNTAGFDSAFVFAPLSTFNLSTIARPSNPLNSVPLGAYTPPDTTLVADPSGREVTPTAMHPTLNPAGLIASPPLAITDLAAARLLRGASPIDAIRVRVAGLTGFDSSSQAKVEAVASEIAQLGLDVDIVAGSSPQAIDLFVPAYDVSSDPPGDLGWVTQNWTTIGAAQRVERGFGQTDETLLVLGIVAAALFAFGLQVLQLSKRTQEIAIQRAIGWSRRQVLVWVTSEAVVAAVAIGALAIAGWLIGGRSRAALGFGLLLAGLWLVAALVGVFFAERSASIERVDSGEVDVRLARWVGRPVTGIMSLGLRSAVARPVRTTVEIVGLALAGATVGLSTVSLAATSAAAGPTLLAAAVGVTIGPMELLLLVGSAACSLAFVVAAVDLDIRSNQHQFEILMATGWSNSDMIRLVASGRLLNSAPAAAIAAIASLVVSASLGLTSTASVAAAAVAVAVAVAAPIAVARVRLVRITG